MKGDSNSMTLNVDDRLTSQDGTVYVVEHVAKIEPAFQYGPEAPAERGALQVRLRPEKSNAE